MFHYLKVLKAKFANQVQNNIGLLGHSRGGEAVVRVANDIEASVAPANLNDVKAIASLAPSDNFEVETLSRAIPFFVLYGSMDTDISGAWERAGAVRGLRDSLFTIELIQ